MKRSIGVVGVGQGLRSLALGKGLGGRLGQRRSERDEFRVR